MKNLSKFKELGLSDNMINALYAKGFEKPTPIQTLTIPFLLGSDKDVVGQAQTGTGKTGAFGIPLVERIDAGSGIIKALIMAPTRELAIQVTEEIGSLSLDRKLKIISIYGGQPIDRQIDRLKRGVDIVVGTPGRVLDHLKRKTMDISKIKYVVLDEADEMLNMGFIDDIETILKSTPKDKKMLLFSATMPKNILNLAKKYMREYEVVSVKNTQLSQENVQQIYFEMASVDKFEVLYRIIDVEEHFYGLVFCRTKIDVDNIVAKFVARGRHAEALHGDITQKRREEILQKFKNKKITVLVATDVAARGIDVNNLTHVINHSLPQDPEGYVHRIGRTGRAGKTGIAITLITPSEYRKLLTIKKLSGATITKQKIPGVKEVIASKKSRIKNAVNAIIATDDLQDLNEIAKEILEGNDANVAIAALLKHAFKNQLSTGNYNEITDISNRKSRDCHYDNRGVTSYNKNSYRGDRRAYVDRKGKGAARLFVAKGKNDGMNPRSLAEFIGKESGINSNKIDDVKIMDDFSFVTTSFEDAQRIIEFFRKNGKRPLVSHAKKRNEKRGNNRYAKNNI